LGKRIIIFLLLMIFIVPVIIGQNEIVIDSNVDSQSTKTKVYVNLPNFKVLSENSHDIFTVIKDSSTPTNYQGTLIKLETEDLGDLKNVIKNLDVGQVIFFKEDTQLANRLIKQNIVKVVIK
jgi:hypothetical protein